MIRARLLTAAALLLAPCLMVGCEDEPETEPSVGGVAPADPVVVDDADPALESGSETEMGTDPAAERPSEELEEEDGGI
ncbi:hypothetical protein [Alienimonas sp. DA493]|uniref:hypothetical protein n=1 Tax=Alienimonas sp. DA493 TaxID=3373605 RepID=UPI003754CD90